LKGSLENDDTGDMIPRKIHYCWFGPKSLPKIVMKCVRTWSEKMPSYEILLWNENNSPMHLPFIDKAYKEGKYAFVSDCVRFWVLYKHGGIYLDTDMFVLRSFDDLLANEIFFGWETGRNENISCGVIGSVPGHPFIRNILDRYNNLQFRTISIPELVVPKVVKYCFDQYPLRHEIAIFPYDFFYAFPYEEKENVKNFMQFQTANSYAIHLWNVSWGKFQDKLRDYILYHFKILWRKIK
jgi:mannosyltransferase OCH1-like enzyme